MQNLKQALTWVLFIILILVCVKLVIDYFTEIPRDINDQGINSENVNSENVNSQDAEAPSAENTNLIISDDQSPDPIVTYRESGGIMGMVKKVEIYSDNSYKIFERDDMIGSGNLNQSQIKITNELVKNKNSFETDYSEKNSGCCDRFYYSIQILDTEIELGVLSDKVPKLIKDGVSNYSKIGD